MVLFGLTVYIKIPAIACKILLFILKRKKPKTKKKQIHIHIHLPLGLHNGYLRACFFCSNTQMTKNNKIQVNQPRLQSTIASKQLYF